MSWLFSPDGQSIGISASASDLPMNSQGWYPFELTSLISFQSKELSKVFSSPTNLKHQFFSAQPSLQSNSHIHPYMITGKTIALTRWTFVGRVMSLLVNMLSWLVITFLPRSKRLLISWLQSPTSTLALLTTPKALTVWITINYGKLLKRWEYQTTWPASWKICRQV